MKKTIITLLLSFIVLLSNAQKISHFSFVWNKGNKGIQTSLYETTMVSIDSIKQIDTVYTVTNGIAYQTVISKFLQSTEPKIWMEITIKNQYIKNRFEFYSISLQPFKEFLGSINSLQINPNYYFNH